MTIQQLINKYTNIQKDYETITLSQVLCDLAQIQRDSTHTHRKVVWNREMREKINEQKSQMAYLKDKYREENENHEMGS